MAILNRCRTRGSVKIDATVRATPLTVVCVYAGLYLGLDQISFVHVLPDVGFTLWNPPPACSLALLLMRGLSYAPALFAVGFIADGLIGFPAGLERTVVADAIIAGGYTTLALVLRRLSHADQGFRNAPDVAWFLLIASLAVLIIASLVTAFFVLTHGLPSSQFVPVAVHFWIGDLTGIMCLLPAVMNMHAMRQRWIELTLLQRFMDTAAFVFGLALALIVIFGVARDRQLHLFYLQLLPVIWIAVRHGLPWSSMAVLLAQLGLISTALLLSYPTGEFLGFQLLSLALSATGLLVGAVVTERQRAESSLRRQQAELDRTARLTTAGALGMAVVHQISQPLATIATYTHACSQLLGLDSTNKDTLAETIAKVEAEVLRAGTIVERLRDFLSGGARLSSRVDLAAVAHEISAALTHDARQRGVDILVYAPAKLSARVDRIQIEQVFVNLIRNAVDATAGQNGPKKHVRVRLRDIDNETEVAVEDDGPGVSPEVATRLFEPLETTKSTGMGLGLWLSRELIEGHGGRLWWDPGTAVGARFVLRLPRDRATTLD